jgi:transporter family-2 protein
VEAGLSRAGANAGGVIWAFVLFGLAAGAMLPFQAGINAQLAEYVGSPLRAALISFVVGALVLVPVVALLARGLPSADRVSAAPWWVWLGGALGAFYVAGSITSAPKLGAVTLIGVILAGQAFASLVVDHFGMVGFEEHPATLGRIAGLALIALGVLFVRLF